MMIAINSLKEVQSKRFVSSATIQANLITAVAEDGNDLHITACTQTN